MDWKAMKLPRSMGRYGRLWTGLLLCLGLVLGGCSGPSTAATKQEPPGGDVGPGVELSVCSSAEQPGVGEEVELTIQMLPREEVTGAVLQTVLPESLELVAGKLDWQGNLQLNQLVQVPITVRVVKEEPGWLLATLTTALGSEYNACWSPIEVQGPPQPMPPERQEGAPSEGTPAYPSSDEKSSSRNSGSGLLELEPAPGVELTLKSTPAQPAAGQDTLFTVSLLAHEDIAEASLRVTLPAGFEHVGGNLERPVDVKAGEAVTLQFQARPLAAPDGIVEARLLTPLGGDYIARLAFGAAGVAPLVPERPRGSPLGEALGPQVMADEHPPQQEEATPPLRPADFTIIAGSGSARTGEPFDVAVFVLANEDLPGADVQFQLPANLQLVAGELSWSGDLATGDVQKLQAVLQRLDAAPATLNAGLKAANGVRADGMRWFGPAVQEDSEGSSESDASQEATAGTLYLSGRFMYAENLTTGRGCYWSHVEVFDADTFGDDFICSDTTDSDGYWSCSGTASDPFDDNLEVYAVVWARNSWYGSIRDGGGTEYAFRTTEYNLDEDGDTQNMGTWWPPGPPTVGHDWDGAWHIQKIVAYGNQACQYAGGERPPNSSEAHWLTGRWPDTDADNSSEYGSWTIYIEGPGSTDPDEWDESVILHEYGHYLMDHFATSPPFDYCHDPGEVWPNCSHSFGSHEDPETAYLEGWANYFQSATKRYKGMTNAHLYQETTWSANLETDWHSTTTTWDDCEGAVAGILWDINDQPNDDQNSDGVGDLINMFHDEIHDTFSFYDPPGTHTNPWTIHEFWNGFTGLHTTVEDEVRRIYWEHGIDKDTVPNAPYSPSPPDGSSGIRLARDLDWYCTDPDGDALTYDVYFEKNDSTPDVLVATGLSASYYDPGSLDPLTHYYWKVVARDLYGKTRTGAIWDFTTAANSTPVLGVVMPDSSSAPVGAVRYYTSTWWDFDGWEDLKQCYFHIGANTNLAGNVTLLYNRNSNKMWIRSNDGLYWMGGYTPGSAAILENGQARVYCQLSSTHGSGVTMWVYWAIEFKAGFTGTKKLGIKCKDMHGGRAKAAWKAELLLY